MGKPPRSGSHGGMCRLRVSAAMPSACFTASAYDSSGNGATSPGRWHGAQFANTIGATSLLNVTGAGADGGEGWPLQPAATAAAIERIRSGVRTDREWYPK